MRLWWIVLSLLTACPGMVRGQDPLAALRNTEEYRAAYKEGRAEADRQLKDQSPTIDGAGLAESLFENLDRETGLPYRNFGCVVDARIEGRIDGHNDRINESIKANGLPKGSFKPWEKELFGLQEYVASRRKQEQPEILKAGGPARKSPDGPCTIRPVVEETEWRDKVLKWLAIEVDGDGRPPRRINLIVRADETVELFWGPKGSGFAVVSTRLGNDNGFVALDLRRGGLLRAEFPAPSEPSRPRPGGGAVKRGSGT